MGFYFPVTSDNPDFARSRSTTASDFASTYRKFRCTNGAADSVRHQTVWQIQQNVRMHTWYTLW